MEDESVGAQVRLRTDTRRPARTSSLPALPGGHVAVFPLLDEYPSASRPLCMSLSLKPLRAACVR